MTCTDTHFMHRDGDDLRLRLSRFLRGQYDGDHAKRLAADIDCHPETAKNVLNQHWPNARTWKGIVRRFGSDVLEAVFTPDIDTTLARLRAEERRLEEQLELARSRRRQVQGPSPGLAADVGPPDEPWAAR